MRSKSKSKIKSKKRIKIKIKIRIRRENPWQSAGSELDFGFEDAQEFV